MACQFKRDECTSCIGNDVSRGIMATAICNFDMTDMRRGEECRRFYREAALIQIAPRQFCCESMRHLFHDSAEESGYLAGAFDIRRLPNDGKDVWRNYRRIKFDFCPFCGKSQNPAKERAI